MGPLHQHLLARIRTTGPLSVADFMAEALANPRHGYYRTAQPLGGGGDFITAPDISQMFGELIGAWLAERWIAMGRPDPCLLAELGPGRGSLMADALRATRAVAGFHAAAKLHLVEINPALRALQAEALAGMAPTWHDNFGELPDGPMLLVANEFLDALPIRQLQRTKVGWCERRIGIADDGVSLRFLVDGGPSPLAGMLDASLRMAPEGSIAEIGTAAIAQVSAIAERLARAGGAALVIDYGRPAPAVGASLQAVKKHRRADPLEDPGQADLTAHVDFTSIATAARQAGARCFGPVGQGVFLIALGIGQRAQALKARATASQGAAIDAALARLIDPAQMGTLFQVLALTDAQSSPPAGFENPRGSP